MREAIYDIHGLVSISARGTSELIGSLDSHIGMFKTNSKLSNFDIEISPFSDFIRDGNGEALDDWVFSENFAIRETRNLAFNLLGEKIMLYADRLELPINLLIEIALLKVGCTFVHSAGIQRDNSGVLFPAPPGVGKTTTVALLVRNGNLLLGDDLCILSPGKIWSYPQSLSVYPYHREVLPRLKFKHQIRLSVIAAKNVLAPKGSGFLSRASRFALSLAIPSCLSIDPAEVFGSHAMKDSAPLSAVVFLQRNNSTLNIKVTSPEADAIAGAAKILWHEWHANFHELLLLDALMYGPHWLESLISRTESIISQAISLVPNSKIEIPACWKAADLSAHDMDFLSSIDAVLRGN